ncbi:hypothetical protein [Methylorubrum sp. SB2]|uniref:hypothetical protein n=1 Tax=Methylorubrum subtropicum TaxID=3138812 RepID=UPI00313C2845
MSEVSRLAGELADQILSESLLGAPSAAKVTALGEAVHLLEDCRHPVPDLVTDVLSRLQVEADDAEPDAPADGHDAAQPPPGRSRFIPRFFRPRRGP